jgi:hypothetical protein
MAGCTQHGWMYWASGGYGRCKYSYCSLCRSQRASEAVSPGATVESNKFLKDHAKALEQEKSVSVRATKVADGFKSSEDSKLSRHEPVTGAAEDEFLSGFGSMSDRWDTDRLKDAILGILEGSVRSAESKYGIDRNTIFRVRLIIATDGVEAGVEKLLAYVRKHRLGSAQEPEQKAA